MTKRRRILHADKLIRNVFQVFCLLMFLQWKDYYTNASNPMLLYSTSTDIRIANISKPGKVNAIIKGLEQMSAVDFLYRRDLICWSDQTAEMIQCINYNNTYVGDKLKIEGLVSPNGIAIDWYTDKIYWTDGETNKIEVISIDSALRKVLFWADVDLPRAIAVVPKEGLMFWTDWGEEPKIERADMDGDHSTRKIIVKDNIFWPNGITIDYNSNSIYWVDAKLQFVDVIDFKGGKRKRIVNEGLQYPYALTYFNDKLYWTDWKTWAIYSWDITTNGSIKELIKSDPVPVDIRVYDDSRQPMADSDNKCRINNGGCSHLCLLSSKEPGYVCACPTGVKLRQDSNTTCYDGPQSMLLVAQRSMISKISLDSPDFTPNTIPLKDLKRAITVDFDPNTEFIYWADSSAKTISKARLDGTEQSVVIHCNGVPDSIAIDPYARNIYYTDAATDTINVATLDGNYMKVVIYDELYEPRAIALHPTAGWMFWSDWNDKKPKIERANLDGTDRVLLVTERLTWPNGIALDTFNNKLYWGDARTHKIEVCNMDGSDRRELHSSDILHIFGLTLLGDHLYWTDMQRRSLDRIDKTTGMEKVAIVEQMANMMGVKAFRIGQRSWGTEVVGNACAHANGGCSHLCFNRPHNNYTCSCPLGLELNSDQRTCVEPEEFLIYSRKNVIGRFSIYNENNDAIQPLKDLKEVSALAVHVQGSKLYWSDSKTKTINRCSINGADMERIIDWLGLVEGLAIDESAQNIYWTDTTAQRIEVARLDGSSRRTLLWQGLKKPKSIVLDPKKGYMYWSELGSKTIKRAGMDGSSPTVVIEQAGRVHALALDHEKRGDDKRLYWAALDPPAIEYAYVDGTGRKILINDVSMPYALTLHRDKVFWGDWNTGLVEVASKNDGSNRSRVHVGLDYISELKVYQRSRPVAQSQCAVDNGGCAHLCLPLPANDYRCDCPAHYRLNRDNLTCTEPEEFLLFAQKNAIGRIVVGTGECIDAFIPLTGLKNVRTIEYDSEKKFVYYIEEESHSIRRVPTSYSWTSAASDSEVVVGPLARPAYMALDSVGRALYWTCLDKDSINATSLDNTSLVGVILRADKMMPRHLAFHQTKRLLVWNDIGLGAIMRARADGTERTELARAANATALTVDASTGLVFWALNRQIHCVDIDNPANKRIVWQGGWTGTLAAFGGHVYLSGGERALMRVPAFRRDAPATPVAHLTRLVAVLAVHKVPREHPCYGGRVCGPAPGACGAGGVCGCGLGCVPPRGCSPNFFLCDLSRHPAATDPHCIPQDWKCDGQLDCPDGSDEGADCGACGGGLRCADGSCAATLGACATGAHCVSAPLPDAFRCDERLCLAPRLLCDGRQHCEDGTDETEAACGNTQKDDSETRYSNVLVVCGAIMGAGAVAAGAWAAQRRCRRRAARRLPHPRVLARVKPPPHDERARPLGASSTEASENLCSRYPRPTANPPPSPATASGGSAAASGCGIGAGPASRRRAYRHYRTINRPPPPTPASTDACESEPEPAARAPPPSPAPLIFTYD